MERGELTGAILDGRYRVIEPLAEGAMGVVYRAERVKLGRIVAIKVLHDVLPNELSARKRFEIEARAMARLEHPHCASVLDVGMYDDRPYVVMDFVSGKNLKELVGEGAQPSWRAADIVRQVLSGLAHAHELGIIHRDIKPANIVLSQKTGLGDHVKILDFGLARLHDTGQNLTTGIVVGTPAYMAPEQIRGVVLDHRVDLYACGVLLFELLTGAKPFHSLTDDPIEVCRMHLSAPIPRLDDLLPGVAFGELEAVVAMALAKDAGERYASAQAFAAALDAAVPRRPSIPALPPTPLPAMSPRALPSPLAPGASMAPGTSLAPGTSPPAGPIDASYPPPLEVRSADVMSTAEVRAGTVAGVAPAPPARTATPVAGVPQSQPPVAGPSRTATPVAGLPQARSSTAGAGPSRTATPVAGVAVGEPAWHEPVSPPGTFLGIAMTPRAATAHRPSSPALEPPASQDHAPSTPPPSGPHAPPSEPHAPPSGPHAPPSGLHAPSSGLHAPPSGLHAPPSGLHAPPSGLPPSGPPPSEPATNLAAASARPPDAATAGAARSVSAAARRRRLALGGGAAVLAVVVIAIVASRGSAPAVPLDAGVAIASGAPAAPVDPVREILDRANELVVQGNKEAALDVLARARRQYPDHADLAYAAGRIYFSKYFWNDGLKSFRDALHDDPRYRTDPELIKTVLRGFLMTPSPNEDLASFLREDIGAAAQPFLEETARDHPSPELRRRAAAELRRYH